VAADDDPELAADLYITAVQTARRSGAGFVDGVASVGLASLRTRGGDVRAAAEGYAQLLDYWSATGNVTQLWTTLRGVARLLVRAGDLRTAVVLLAASDGAGSAAAVDDHEREVRAELERRLAADDLSAAHRAAADTGPSQAVVLARGVLSQLV
jgi:hypothetical protein